MRSLNSLHKTCQKVRKNDLKQIHILQPLLKLPKWIDPVLQRVMCDHLSID
jgi:hypothetical protein